MKAGNSAIAGGGEGGAPLGAGRSKAGGGARVQSVLAKCLPGSGSWACSAGPAPGGSRMGASSPPEPASPGCLSHPATAAEAAPSRGQSRAPGGRPPFNSPPPVRPQRPHLLRLGPPPPRPLPHTSSPAGSGSPPILALSSRPVPLSYKLLDGEATRPALVFLHGLFGCKTNFNSIAKALAQQTGRRVSFRERRSPAGGGASSSALTVGPGLSSGRPF